MAGVLPATSSAAAARVAASYPLTDWANVESRLSAAASWQPYGGPGGWNDYDSIEVGNGSNGGLTVAESRISP